MVKIIFLGRREMKKSGRMDKMEATTIEPAHSFKTNVIMVQEQSLSRVTVLCFSIGMVKNWKMGPGLFIFIHSQDLSWYLPPRYLILIISSFVSRISYCLEARKAHVGKFLVLIGNVPFSSTELNNVKIYIIFNSHLKIIYILI